MQRKLCDLLCALYFGRGGLQTRSIFIDLILQETDNAYSLISS
jgi:hypothetical protein